MTGFNKTNSFLGGKYSSGAGDSIFENKGSVEEQLYGIKMLASQDHEQFISDVRTRQSERIVPVFVPNGGIGEIDTILYLLDGAYPNPTVMDHLAYIAKWKNARIRIVMKAQWFSPQELDLKAQHLRIMIGYPRIDFVRNHETSLRGVFESSGKDTLVVLPQQSCGMFAKPFSSVEELEESIPYLKSPMTVF